MDSREVLNLRALATASLGNLEGKPSMDRVHFNVFPVSRWGEGTRSRKELCVFLTLYPASPVWH